MKTALRIALALVFALVVFATGCEFGFRDARADLSAELNLRARTYGTLSAMFGGAQGAYFAGRSEAYQEAAGLLK